MCTIKNKLYPIACADIEYLGDIKVVFQIDQSGVQLFVTDYQIAQIFQVNMFVRKCYYF